MVSRTRAFRIGPRLAKVSGAYPLPNDVFAAAEVGTRERTILARLWISEGIPFAFRQCPGLYEEVRKWLADGLELDPKQISIAGSARLGYSLAPKKWGEPYQSNSSDLDFFAVSERLFEGLCHDFERWSNDYVCNSVRPRTDRDRFYWDANRLETPRSIQRGFLDSKRVPNLDRYGLFQRMNNRLAYLSAKLHKMDWGPKPPRRLTLRCYKDWASYERQLDLSLKAVADRDRIRRSRPEGKEA